MPELNDFYQRRELNLVLEYFERKARGDVSIPVPSLSVFERAVESENASLALATYAERELRALYLGIGAPVSQAAAAEFTECWQSGKAAITDVEICELESELDDLESKIESMEIERDRIRDELDEKRGDKERQAVRLGCDYLPEDLMPVIEKLQREGA